MPQTKFEYYTTLATQTTAQLTASMENWTSFLETAARLYKYPYHDQLMIFAQRPDATACADFDTWNKTMGRYIRRGSKGIALIDHTTGIPKIKYVYDLADTGTRQSSRPVNLWQLDEEHMDTVFYALEQNYSVSDIYLTDVLETIAASLAEEFWENHAADVLGILANSFLEEYTEDTVGVRFREAVTVSATYVLMTRCGIKPETPFTHEDFLPVFEFNTTDTIAALGTAVSTISRQVLRDIELSIKIYERTKNHETEQPDLHDHRGLSVPQPDLTASADPAPGQIRENAEDLSGGTPTGAVQSSDSIGEVVSAPVGDRADSEPEAGADDAGVGEAERGDGDDEGSGPDAVGADDEQSESPSGRSDSERTDLRITEPYVRGTQISIFDMIPSEAEQIQAIDEAESVDHAPFAFSVPEEVITHVLQLDGNHENARMEVATAFSKGKSPEELAAFLQNLFHDGCGIVVEEKKYAVWYGEEGIRIAVGDSARYTETAKILPWSEVVERIDTMLDSGTYATNVELAEMRGYEVKTAAEHLWFMHHHMSDEARERFFDPSFLKGSYDESTALIASVLEDDVREVIVNETSRFAEEYARNNSLMRFRRYTPDKIFAELNELNIPRRDYRSFMMEIPTVGHFITEDEMYAALADGGNIEKTKERIYAYFRESHTTKEQANFLKEEYGFSGKTIAHTRIWLDSRDIGITLRKDDCPDIQINWTKAAKYVAELVRKDIYLTEPEKTRFTSMESQYDDAGGLPTPKPRYGFPSPDTIRQSHRINDYASVKERYPEYLILVEAGDSMELYGEDAYIAAELLGLMTTFAELPNVGWETVCSFPMDMLEPYMEQLRSQHDVVLWAVDRDTGERKILPMVSIDHEAEQAINVHEAEFGADGTREFNGERQLQAQLDRYVPIVSEMVEQETPYRNACCNSEKEYARIECTAAVVRALLASEDMELLKLFSDDPDFRESLLKMVFDTTYDKLLQSVSQEDIDDFADIDPDAIREILAERGIENGVVVDPEVLSQDPVIRQVLTDTEQSAFMEKLVPYKTTFSIDEQTYLIYRINHDTNTVDYYNISGTYISSADDFQNVPVSEIRKYVETEPTDAQLLAQAKALINYFCYVSQTGDADFSDLSRIVILDTFIEDEDIPYRITVDLVHFRLETCIGDGAIHVTDTHQYQSLQELIDLELRELSIDDLMLVEKEDIERFRQLETEHSVRTDGFLYTVGDTVYLDNRPFEIVQITDSHVHLLDPALAYPIERVENIENFHMFLQRDYRNGHITDYLSADLDMTDTDLQEILTDDGGLLTQSDKDAISEWFQNGDGNTRVAKRLAEKFAGTVETMSLISGEEADYRATARGLEITIEDKFHTEQFFRWEDIAPVLRAMYQQERDGFVSKQEEQVVPELPPDTPTEAELDEAPVSIQIGDEWQTFPNVEAAEQASLENFRQNLRNNATNFHITDDNLGVGGPKVKYQANIAAIKLLQYLEENGFQANPDQQEVLSRYVGWGGLAEAFDPNKANWHTEYIELQDLLTPEEYEAARASTLNAHYTSPTVIKAIYEAVGNMGFQSGNILEPSMGVGNFFGLLPETMSQSRLYGVELDSITGRIAKQLYPKANITVAGFETTDRRDFFDLAIGNVPFGNYKVNDKAYNKLGFSIHNYFFAKALDQVRPGGVVAFVTSRYTMDSESPEVRRYLAERADLLGAIRLPNNAFKANAGTEVTTDIIFLQKRDRPMVVEPDWVHLGLTEDGFGINSYFTDHPEMVLGTLTEVSTQYGRQDFTVEPIPGASLADQLHEAVQHIRGTYTEVELPDLGENEPITTTIPADPTVKDYSFTVMDGEVYFRENSIMVQPNLNATAKERVKGMVELRDCVHDLINRQLEGASDAEILEIQQHLNTLYDNYTMQYGLLNDRANRLAFADDSSYYLLCSLEILNDDQTLKRKADIFTKRTIKVQEVATSVDTAAEALAVSIAEKACVDLPYMSGLSGKPAEELISDLRGVIFQLPESPETYVTADEYLSGNVREKLRQAENAQNMQYGDYSTNIEALTAAIPKDLDASEIEVRLGATWIEPEIVKQFMFELLKTPYYCRHRMDVQYSEYSGEWNVSGKSMDASSIAANYTYGTDCANAYKIIEDTLNLRDVRIYDVVIEDGKEHRVLNIKETTLAQQKQQAIKDAFRDWIWQDSDRREMLVAKYNVRFNSIVPRTYNGEHIVFHGMNPEITLREHQKNAVAHILYGGNTLLAHEVGAGKTFTMVASAMESKRLGLCSKPMFAVPNHLTEQWASEFLRLYPSANILVTTKKDFEPANRKKFCARIATGSYDAIIIGHSQFEKIPISSERQERLLREQIAEITEGIAEMGNGRKNDFTVKQMERTRKGLQLRLEKLTAADRKDDVITFEQLGVDRLYVDEAHNYKNSFIFTKMRNVAGLSTTDAQKSADMLMKCRYLDEITGSRGVVFATGTPVSNSMTELYVMMRYLQNDTLKDRQLQHFDAWASTFGETVTAIELAPEGTGYRARTRFAKFFNLPELMKLFREVADIKTADQLNLPTPLATYHNVVAEPTEIQRAMVQELSMRASVIHEGGIDPKDDNMLKVTSDGRKLGLDQRIINPILPDEPGTKVNLCVENIFRIWEEGKDERLTQLVFSDLSTPKTKTKPPRTTGAVDAELHGIVDMVDREVPEEAAFNVYEDIRQKLVERGVPREEIAFIHEADTEVKKKELFAKVRSGSVRVLIGSTAKMGAGTNCQDRLIALHDLDAPWRPGDLEQRKGRIVRQGNRNPEVQIYRYVTNATFDAYLWQTLENKQRFISQIMTSKSPVRSCDDVDEASLSYAEVKALCAGDPRIRERMDLEVEVNKLKMLKASHQSRIFKMQDEIKHHYPETIASVKQAIAGLEKDQITAEANKHPADGFIGMVVRGDTLTDKDNAGAALLEACKEVKGTEPVSIGTYRGFQMSLTLKDFGRQYILTLKSRMSHVVELGQDVRGNLIRIDNALAQIPNRIEAAKTKLQLETEQLAVAKVEVTKPFPQEDELRTKVARLVELDAVLNLDNKPRDEPGEQTIDKGRPSVLERIREPVARATGTPEKKKVKQQEVL